MLAQSFHIANLAYSKTENAENGKTHAEFWALATGAKNPMRNFLCRKMA